MKEAAARLNELLEKWEGMGVDRNKLATLAAPRHRRYLNHQSEPANYLSSNKPFLSGVFAATLLAVYLAGLHTSSGLARAWILWNGGDIYNEKCAVWMPDSVIKAVRPPEDCSMCRHVTQVDKVKDISPEEFENIYAYSGRPVVVTDATDEWSAPSIFSFQFLKELYRGSGPDHHQDNCQFFPYETEFASLSQVFNMSYERAHLQDGAKPWYIGWSNCDERVARRLREHYDRPYFLPLTAENKNIDWIFMGSPGYGAKMHVDNVNNPSWQAQLVGSKKWTLAPPPECIYQCKTVEVTVNPGEIIVLDTNRWYHKTLIVSEGISITIGAEYD